MPELYHQWGCDLVVSPTGDLMLVSGTDEGTQRVLRRLMTPAMDYLWDLGYGAGLPAKVGTVAVAQTLKALIRRQMFMESAVSKTPEPVINISVGTDNTVYASIQYVDNTTMETATIRNYPLSP